VEQRNEDRQAERKTLVEVATQKRDVRRCASWGLASIISGAVTGLVTYTLITGGTSIHDDAARGLTTASVGALIIGLMCVLAAKLMHRTDLVRRDHARAEASARMKYSDLQLKVDALVKELRALRRPAAEQARPQQTDNNGRGSRRRARRGAPAAQTPASDGPDDVAEVNRLLEVAAEAYRLGKQSNGDTTLQ